MWQNSKVNKSDKTFVVESNDTNRSHIVNLQINLNNQYININHIFAKYCHPRFNRIYIYQPTSNQFINIKQLKSKNGSLAKYLFQPHFIFIRYNKRHQTALQESDLSIFELNSPHQRQERSKERTIAQVIDLVKKWRNLHQTCLKPNSRKKKLNLQEAAKIVGISKKSLDDYYCQLRLAESYNFDFENQIHQKIGVLRTFVKNHKTIEEKDKQNVNTKHPKQLKVIEEPNASGSRTENINSSENNENNSIIEDIDRQNERERNQIVEQEQMNDLENEFYRGFQFALDQPIDPFLNLNRNFSIRVSDDESNQSLIFL